MISAFFEFYLNIFILYLLKLSFFSKPILFNKFREKKTKKNQIYLFVYDKLYIKLIKVKEETKNKQTKDVQ